MTPPDTNNPPRRAQRTPPPPFGYPLGAFVRPEDQRAATRIRLRNLLSPRVFLPLDLPRFRLASTKIIILLRQGHHMISFPMSNQEPRHDEAAEAPRYSDRNPELPSIRNGSAPRLARGQRSDHNGSCPTLQLRPSNANAVGSAPWRLAIAELPESCPPYQSANASRKSSDPEQQSAPPIAGRQPGRTERVRTR